MLSETVLQAIQYQMNNELTNSYMYTMFAGIADYQGLTGTTSWFSKQADEERGHFEKFRSYVCDQGHIPHLLQLPEQKPEMLTLPVLFDRTVELEMQTLAYLQALAGICKAEGDDQTYNLLLWFLSEQVEEVKTVTDIKQRIFLSANNLILIDQELGSR